MTGESAQLFDEPSTAPPPDAGARYWRCDLHVHTPRDRRWPAGEPRTQDERRALAKKYLTAAQARGVEVIGVTEHHDVSWIDELRYAARGLGMYVLPGFELETSEGIHVLCLFDPGRSVLELEDVLASLGLDRNRRSTNKATEIRSGLPLADVLGVVQDRYAGICIAAHVTSRKGILDLPPGGARADAWRQPALLAAQIPCVVADVPNQGVRSMLANEDSALSRRRARPCFCVALATSPPWRRLMFEGRSRLSRPSAGPAADGIGVLAGPTGSRSLADTRRDRRRQIQTVASRAFTLGGPG